MFWIALGAIALLAVVLASAFHLGGSLTVDEPLVANTVHLSWGELRQVFPHDDLPLYYVSMKGWTYVFGDSEPALRSFSLLCLGSAIVAIGSAARLLLGVEAAAVILLHNHPSGSAEPSAEDRALTERLERAGELLGIRVLDHIVVGDGEYRSKGEGW
jgi:hypothetical protein